MIGPSILMYHSIADNADNPYMTSVFAFQEQISWLARHFEIVPLSFLLHLIKSGSSTLSKKVVITFDDGYRDFVTNALPILLDHRAPATVFLVTGMLGGKSFWSKFGAPVSLMCEDEVRYIKAQGISLGSHTATHAKLTLLGHQDIQRQLRDSRDRLTHLGESFYAFSYPWGQWSGQILYAVKTSGYECAVTAGGDLRQGIIDTYRLPRIVMRSDMELRSFQALFKSPMIKRFRRFGKAMKKCFF